MYINELFSEATLIKQLNVNTALAAASYPASGAFVDVSGYERFAFLVQAGSLDSELTCQVQQAKTINGTPKAVTDAVVVIPDDGDNKWYLVEVQTNRLDSNNGYRYVTLAISGAAGSNDYGAVTFFGINPGYRPVTQGSDMGEVVTLVG